jgi:hypothetical protein
MRPERALRFAGYFKGYMGISSLIVAALPIPVASLRLLPMYGEQQKPFCIYASLFCFLTFAYVFYMRHMLARLMFLGRSVAILLPLIPVAGAVFCLWSYHQTLQHSLLSQKRERLIGFDDASQVPPDLRGLMTVTAMPETTQTLPPHLVHGPTAAEQRKLDTIEILEKTHFDEIPDGTVLLFEYLGFFVLAELAFVLMTTREYMQDVLMLDEASLYQGSPNADGQT